jgi:hypothetical protein
MVRKSITVEVLSRSTGEWCRGVGATIQEARLNAFKAERKPKKKLATPARKTKGASA